MRAKKHGSVCAVGGDITVDGRIGKDALIAGNTIDLAANAQIGRDLNIAARTATVNGHVGRNVAADVQTLHIGGPPAYTAISAMAATKPISHRVRSSRAP